MALIVHLNVCVCLPVHTCHVFTLQMAEMKLKQCKAVIYSALATDSPHARRSVCECVFVCVCVCVCVCVVFLCTEKNHCILRALRFLYWCLKRARLTERGHKEGGWRMG